ncbi:uncharacterized protein F4812DRAFT_444818 [Daldinia caldariorum]|uniref:uncharacterized protein n=1 Tax=Daldinia caldariorum TaxID=326644 RepID=UPI0020087D67|nr:uncharacterized protein F4812DRAFT_444818 [Daldinia caldariorum]KAI1463878.1 hypothetical protein F4812DRAFT_444818 [Daldinia caldariorum]
MTVCDIYDSWVTCYLKPLYRLIMFRVPPLVVRSTKQRPWSFKVLGSGQRQEANKHTYRLHKHIPTSICTSIQAYFWSPSVLIKSIYPFVEITLSEIRHSFIIFFFFLIVNLIVLFLRRATPSRGIDITKYLCT